MNTKIPRLTIAGTNSGIGKTTITCSIIYGLSKLGYKIQPFKVGPDYIDPSYLSVISGRTAHNLDSWLMGDKELLQCFVRNSSSDISVVEGVMGFYDGFSGKNELASTYHISRLIKSPVILVLDASKIAGSIAAMAYGYMKFKNDSRIVGVIVNKIASKKHEIMCKDALEKLKIPILGFIPKNPEIDLQSRHLGLIPTFEDQKIVQKIKQTSKIISEFINFEKIITIAKTSKPLQTFHDINFKKSKVKIGIALDNSFNFYYKGNLDALRREGARLEFFSPINSEFPDCDALYFGGGFPEILGNKLSKNFSMLKNIKKFSEQNFPVYAECGGLMYLTKSISYASKKYRMVGLFDAETIMTQKMKLNYTKGKISNSCILGPGSSNIYGHEFHYSELTSVPQDTKFAYSLEIGEGIMKNKDGIIQDNTLASYGHIYFDRSKHASEFVKKTINTLKK